MSFSSLYERSKLGEIDLETKVEFAVKIMFSGYLARASNGLRAVHRNISVLIFRFD